MADCAIFVLWDQDTGLALMEDRPEYLSGSAHHWVYPGGKFKPGEDAYTAFKREMAEELGRDVQPVAWRAMFPCPVTGTNGYAAHVFLVTEWTGAVPPRIQDKPGTPLKWVSPRDILLGQPAGPTAVQLIAAALTQVAVMRLWQR